MNKTKIEWCDYTVNPIKGLCKHACWYCYARRMYKRFKWNPKVRFECNELKKIIHTKPNDKIFICSTHDIMGKWISDGWIRMIINSCDFYKDRTFIFLTKNPQRYSDFDFPNNCWLGASYDGLNHPFDNDFNEVICSNIKFLSIEPYLATDYQEADYIYPDIDWIIVGGLTPKPAHRKEWVDNIVDICKRKKIPIFLKNNLHYPKKIQEFPERINHD